MPETSRQPHVHLGYVDSLRGLAAVYVIFYHCYILTTVVAGIPQGYMRLASSVFTYGHQAVDLFLVISGFCLMLPALNNDYQLRGGFWTFLKKRARRILPPYYAILVLTLLGIFVTRNRPPLTPATGFITTIPLTGPGVLAHLFLVQDTLVAWNGQINAVLWSICVEWRIYLALPLVLVLWRRWGAGITLAITTAVAAALCLLLPWLGLNASPWEAVGMNPHYLILFVMGLAASDIAYGRGKGKVWQQKPWLAIAVAFFVAGVVGNKAPLAIWQGHTMPYPLSDVLFGAGSAALLISLATQGGNGFAKALNHPKLVWVGTFAYSIYLMHMVILRLVTAYFLPFRWSGFTLTFVALIVIVVPAALIAGYCFFLLFERPFLSSSAKKAATVADTVVKKNS